MSAQQATAPEKTPPEVFNIASDDEAPTQPMETEQGVDTGASKTTRKNVQADTRVRLTKKLKFPIMKQRTKK